MGLLLDYFTPDPRRLAPASTRSKALFCAGNLKIKMPGFRQVLSLVFVE